MNRLIVVLACALPLLAAACSTDTPGNATMPTSAPSVSSPVPTTTPAATTSRLFPPRSRDIDLAGVDPCTVLTESQMRELSYDPSVQQGPASTVYGGPVCNYGSTYSVGQPVRHVITDIGISTSEGVEAWLTDPARKSLTAHARKESVAGFPALTFTTTDKTLGNGCSVELDVHDGQYLDVQSGSQPGKKPADPDSYCVEAKRVAGMAIQTIESQR